MAEEKDYTKLQKFIEAALTNPLHPIYRLGYSKSGMLQSYAINVMMLESIKPAQWFADYPNYVQRLEDVMALCESIDPPNPPKAAEVKPVTEAAPMMDVKCPKCGATFEAPLPKGG